MKCFSCLNVEFIPQKRRKYGQNTFQDLPQKMNLISDLFSRVVFSDRDACQDLVRSDFIGGGRTIYEVFRSVREPDGQLTSQYPVGNGVHEIYINLEIPLGDDSELDHLLCYIKETTTENEDARFSHIISSVNTCRKDGSYMKYYSSHEFFEEGRKEGREEGHKDGLREGKNSIIRKMLSMNQSPEFIGQCTEQPVEYIQQIAKEELMLVREESGYNIEKD